MVGVGDVCEYPVEIGGSLGGLRLFLEYSASMSN